MNRASGASRSPACSPSSDSRPAFSRRRPSSSLSPRPASMPGNTVRYVLPTFLVWPLLLALAWEAAERPARRLLARADARRPCRLRDRGAVAVDCPTRSNALPARAATDHGRTPRGEQCRSRLRRVLGGLSGDFRERRQACGLAARARVRFSPSLCPASWRARAAGLSSGAAPRPRASRARLGSPAASSNSPAGAGSSSRIQTRFMQRIQRPVTKSSAVCARPFASEAKRVG